MSIEKCFGVWKRRFPSLKFGLRFKDPEDSCIHIVAASVLHNICQSNGDWFDYTEIEPQPENEATEAIANYQAGINKRNRIASII